MWILLKLENLLRWSFFTFIYNRSSEMNYFIIYILHIWGYSDQFLYMYLLPYSVQNNYDWKQGSLIVAHITCGLYNTPSCRELRQSKGFLQELLQIQCPLLVTKFCWIACMVLFMETALEMLLDCWLSSWIKQRPSVWVFFSPAVSVRLLKFVCRYGQSQWISLGCFNGRGVCSGSNNKGLACNANWELIQLI